jgi:hypothetical protein
MEAVLSLRHIFRVAKAVNVDPLTSIEGAVVYITEGKDAGIVAETWRLAFQDPPKLGIVVVNGLPRGAQVEWHVLRCQKMEEEEGRRAVTRISFDDEVDGVLNEFTGQLGALCIVFGNLRPVEGIQARLRKLITQQIPSNAIYSLDGGSFRKRNSCIALITG